MAYVLNDSHYRHIPQRSGGGKLRKLTDNVSGHVAEAVARQIRYQLLGDHLRRYEEKHGGFSDEELAEAHSKFFGAVGSTKDADAA